MTWTLFGIIMMTILIIASFACIAVFVPNKTSNVNSRQISMNYPPLNVHIVSIETRELNELIDLHNTNIQNYANLHNYTYSFHRKIASHLPVFFWKLELVLATLRD